MKSHPKDGSSCLRISNECFVARAVHAGNDVQYAPIHEPCFADSDQNVDKWIVILKDASSVLQGPSGRLLPMDVEMPIYLAWTAATF